MQLDNISNKRGKRGNYNTKPLVLKCKVCGKENFKYNDKIGSTYCSWPCYELYKENNTKPNTKCEICGKEFYLKPYRIKRAKNGITCSLDCHIELKKIYMKGEKNHQHGLVGDKNASFKGKEIINQYGYIMLYLPNHPKADENGRYRKHRYVVEQDLNTNDSLFDIIDNQRVLKDEYLVHHQDENKLNNERRNLMVLTKAQHTAHHNMERSIQSKREK